MLKKLKSFLILTCGFASSYSWAAAPLVNPLTEQYVAPGETLSVRISGWDPDGGVPGLYIENMPAGASFDDNGDGTRTFVWTPEYEDIGFLAFTVVATDAQADGSANTSELYVTVDELEYLDYYLEPPLLEVTDFALTSIHPNGDFFLNSVSFDAVYNVAISEDIDVGFGSDYAENYIFGIGPRQLEIFSNFSYGNYFFPFDEISSDRPFPWGTQSRLSADDHRVVVLDGAYEPAIIHENVAGVWIEEAKLEPPASTNTAQRYTSNVVINGQTIVTGHSVDDELNGNRLVGSGAVRVYDYDSSQWSNTTVIKAPNPDEHDQFGSALALDGDILVVSAIAEGSAGAGNNADMFNNDFAADDPYSSLAETSGAVYVYERVSGAWVNTAYLKASDNTKSLRFGTSLAIDGNRIYIGAPGRNIDTSANHFDYNGNPTDKNEGAVYVFEKNSDGTWMQTQILESVDTEDKFGLYLSAKNDALAVGSSVATTLFALQDDQWNSLWHSRVAPYSVALGTEALAIGTPEGLSVLAVDDFYYAEEGYVSLDTPVFYGENFDSGVYTKTIQAGEEATIVISARQSDHVPGLFLSQTEFGATLEDNLDGTRTFRWQSSENDNGVYFFEVVATNALDSSVRSTAFIDIYIED